MSHSRSKYINDFRDITINNKIDGEYTVGSPEGSPVVLGARRRHREPVLDEFPVDGSRNRGE